MKKLNQLILMFLAIMSGHASFAQEVEMADTMRSEGKIYVVVAIILVLFIGLIIYLISIDRKVSNLEKRLPSQD